LKIAAPPNTDSAPRFEKTAVCLEAIYRLAGTKPLLPAICVTLRMRGMNANWRDESTRPTALVPARRTTLPATTTSFATWAAKVFPTGSFDETVWFVRTSNVVPAGIVAAKDHDGTSQPPRKSRRIFVFIGFGLFGLGFDFGRLFLAGTNLELLRSFVPFILN
jgi:hypothetical protein